MKIFQYAIFRIKNETPELRRLAASEAHIWVADNLSHLPKFDNRRTVAYQTYMKAFIDSYIKNEWKKLS